MKIPNLLSPVLCSSYLSSISASCALDKEVPLPFAIKKVTINDYDVESINRFTSATPGSKVVLKGYFNEPIVTFGDDGILTVAAGEPCAFGSSSAFSLATAVSPLIMTNYGIISPLVGFVTAMLMGLPFSSASENSITIDIYTDVDSIIHEDAKTLTCPPESFYYKHHPTVHNGYAGCVGEKFLLPCGQDAQGADESDLYSMYPMNWDGSSCVSTGYTFENRTFWILWGNPLDTHELLSRTGLSPTVKFPLERGPYPAHTHGTDETVELYDDASSAKAKAKDFLVYLGAITEDEKSNWYVSMTEGAEQGISVLWAAKALEIAQTTCNRNIYVLMEAPAYGYDNGIISSWVNNDASSFYSDPKCLCFPNCNEPTVEVINRGFFPPNVPSELGGDNVTYIATSNSPDSPWFESLVFPENPSGRIKVPLLTNPNRRVCDGVYVWPMYFVYNDFKIPLEDRPDCSGWAYATTKGLSANVRSGFITYKKSPDIWVSAIKSIMALHDTLSYGSYSEWSWMGQMQLQDMMMSKPLSDPTSWVGAYSAIMKEKWKVVRQGFKDCPVVTLTNSGKGAYAFFLYKAPYLGLQTSFVSSFFLDVLGVSSTTYYWGFRGADPSEFYGEGVGTHDFTRMQLYRDIDVYHEVARRAKIVCSDTSASVGDFISIDDWKAKSEALVKENGERRGIRHLREVMSHLTERQLKVLESNQNIYDEYKTKAETCSNAHYSTSCLFHKIGKSHSDTIYDEDLVSKPVDKGLR